MWNTEIWDRFLANVLLYLPRIATAILIFLIFWAVARGVGRVVERLTRLKHIDPYLTDFLGRFVRLILLMLGVVTALGTLGIDVTALVAGVGLTGFALGLALKDTIANAVSGIMILLYHPFRVGDTINAQSMEGEIVEINLRYTVLEAEGQRRLLPNSLLFNNPVTVKPRTPDESAPYPGRT